MEHALPGGRGRTPRLRRDSPTDAPPRVPGPRPPERPSDTLRPALRADRGGPVSHGRGHLHRTPHGQSVWLVSLRGRLARGAAPEPLPLLPAEGHQPLHRPLADDQEPPGDRGSEAQRLDQRRSPSPGVRGDPGRRLGVRDRGGGHPYHASVWSGGGGVPGHCGRRAQRQHLALSGQRPPAPGRRRHRHGLRRLHGLPDHRHHPDLARLRPVHRAPGEGVSMRPGGGKSRNRSDEARGDPAGDTGDRRGDLREVGLRRPVPKRRRPLRRHERPRRG